jgi:hypothetical protein
MKKLHIILACLILFISVSASAQFRKPLNGGRSNGQIKDAKVNIGLVGGGNFTTWFHFNSAESADWYLANYTPLPCFGYFGGLAFEYMLSPTMSIGFNAVYTQHNVKLHYVNDHFPNGYQQWVQRYYYLNANYQSVEAYVPFTFYLTTASKNIKPYFYVAPRVKYILNGKMTFNTVKLDANNDTISNVTTAAFMNDSTYRKLNVGATVGVGTQVRFNTSNYYFLVKFDLSANMNALQTFSKYDLENEFNHLRYGGSAQASVTFMVPIKKRLMGACMKWGEYD